MKQHKQNEIFTEFQADNKALFEQYGMPTTKLERWKYTKIPKLLIDQTSSRVISNSKYLKTAIDAETIIKSSIPTHGKQYDMSLWNLNNACFTEIIYIDIPDGEIVEEPILIDSNNSGHLRTIIKLGRNSSVTIIEKDISANKTIKNHVKQILLADNAILNHITIQNDELQSVNASMTHVNLSSSANYNSFTLNKGSLISRSQFHIDINGQGASSSVNAVNLLSGKQHADLTIFMNHDKSNCTSSQFVRSVLNDSSRAVFQGKTLVSKNISNIDATQMSNALMLSNLSEMDNKPELEIYSDDVKCAHGATCGFIDDEQLFYLRSRGIPEESAKKLLTQAFINEVIQNYPDDIQDIINAEIGDNNA